MSIEHHSDIPEHCLDCPNIVPYIDGIKVLRLDIELLQRTRTLLEQQTSPEVVEERIADLQHELLAQETALDVHKVLTIGCAGVRISQAKLDDEYLNDLECRSPLL